MKTHYSLQRIPIILLFLGVMSGLSFAQTKTYNVLYSDPVTTYKINDFQFLDNFGWATSAYSSIYRRVHKTFDNGKTWTAQAAPTCPSGSLLDAFYRLHYFDSLNVVYVYSNAATKNRSFYSSKDGGKTLDSLSISNTSTQYQSASNYKLTFLTKNFWYQTFTGYSIQTSKTVRVIIVTKDGGKTWEDLTNNLFVTANRDVFDLQFVTPSTAYANNYHGDLLKSIDGGQSWAKIGSVGKPSSGTGEGIIHFIDEKNGYMSRNSGAFSNFEKLYVTSDGGKTFSETTLNENLDWKYFVGNQPKMDIGPLHKIVSIDFFDKNNGIILGDYNNGTNLLLRTNDGGSTWTQDSIVEGVPGNQSNGNFSKQAQYKNSTTAYHLFGSTILKFGDGTTSTGSSELTHHALQAAVYPNPSNSGYIQVKTSELSSISIHNVSGLLVYQSSQLLLKHDLQNMKLNTGLYIISISNNKETINKKVIIR